MAPDVAVDGANGHLLGEGPRLFIVFRTLEISLFAARGELPLIDDVPAEIVAVVRRHLPCLHVIVDQIADSQLVKNEILEWIQLILVLILPKFVK